jgi:hypothetical protein
MSTFFLRVHHTPDEKQKSHNLPIVLTHFKFLWRAFPAYKYKRPLFRFQHSPVESTAIDEHHDEAALRAVACCAHLAHALSHATAHPFAAHNATVVMYQNVRELAGDRALRRYVAPYARAAVDALEAAFSGMDAAQGQQRSGGKGGKR